MAIIYGALRGKFEHAEREDKTKSPHLQIRVLVGDTPWRIAVNVQSQDNSQVVYWVVNAIGNHPIVSAAAGLPAGFTRVEQDGAHALDFVKAPLFEFASGLRLPPSGKANDDDLQDLLLLHLNQLKTAGGDLVVFGAKFERNEGHEIDKKFGNTTGLNGVHDIHMNQGNPKGGKYFDDNRPFQDGGLLLAFPDRTLGLFLAFQTQEIPTDLAGNPAEKSAALSALIGAGGPGKPPVKPGAPGIGTVYLERALINPSGDDVGHETVVIGNLTTAPVDLNGWTLRDTNGKTSSLTGTIDGGASKIVVLDGNGVQLGNKRGNLLLLDKQGQQVDAVTYTGEDAKVENRYVEF